MTAPRRTLLYLILLLYALIAPHGAPRAFAEAGTLWKEAAHSRLRLIASGDVPYLGRKLRLAGLQIELDKEWKTYWRTPGDGLPPAIDFAGSENLKTAEALWPVPKRLGSPDGLVAFGYVNSVILPIRIVPKVVDRPVVLSVRFSYGVCADICVPVEASLRLEIPPATDGAFRDTLRAALELVPKQQERGVYCPHSVIAARHRTINGRPVLLIKTAFDDRATGLDLFVEGPDGFEMPPPERQPRTSRGRMHYMMSFDNAKDADALTGQMLTLTTVADQGSCETRLRVE